jgi:fumarate hydratase subunit alpha
MIIEKNTSIEDGIVAVIKKAETELPQDIINALNQASKIEIGVAKTQIDTILKNIDLAKQSQRPMCQDTGIQTFFVEVGYNFPKLDQIQQWIIKGVKRATNEIPLRPNTVDPFTGKNHLDNTGDHLPYITWDIVDGNQAKITVLPKGGGSENMSKLGMLKPGVGLNGVKNFIIQEILNAAGNPCPPVIVGVGIGGGADLSLKLGKRALLKPIGSRNPNKDIAAMEKTLIKGINKSNIGPMGLGGKTTVLDLHIEKAHRHPASLPVGIVVQCWANRHATLNISNDLKWEVQ